MEVLAQAKLPTKHGVFDLYSFDSGVNQFPHVALVKVLDSQLDDQQFMNLRVHSECMTGDVFSSVKCDCGEQLEFSLDYMAKNGGMVIYLRQEGRGIGLVNKIKAYALQEKGFDTIQANHQLGFDSDSREYSAVEGILKNFKVKQVKLLTNNPDKIAALENLGFEVIERVPIEIEAHAESELYLQVKKDQMGHMLHKL